MAVDVDRRAPFFVLPTASMRIAIVGNSGSGKSTLARELAEVHSLASLDLDSIVWEQGKIAVLRSPVAAEADLDAFCDAHERWVIEGCYGNLMRRVLGRQPALLFLDPGVEVCLANCRNRPWEAQKYASREEQEAQLEFLLCWVEEYYSRNDTLSLADHRTLFDAYTGAKLRLTHPADRCLIEVQPLRWFGADALRLGHGPAWSPVSRDHRSTQSERRAPARPPIAQDCWCSRKSRR